MKRIRRHIFVAILILIAFGTVMIYSSSGIYSYEKYGNRFFYLFRHARFLVIGFLALGLGMLINVDHIRKYSKWLIITSFFLLTLVFIPGISKSAGGASRWVDLIFIRFQPSELVKVLLIVYFADFLARKTHCINHLVKGILPALIILGVMGSMVLAQPDFGMLFMMVLIVLSMYIVAGIDFKYFFYAFLTGIPVLYLLIFRVEYRRKRVLSFLDPWQDSQGGGFQVIQSFLALGSGGLWGAGLGKSTQKLYFLPESHTDFIFSIIGEELGFAGCATIVFLFFIIMFEGMRAVFKINSIYRRLIAFGIIFMITAEALVNIFVGIGLFPTKGLPLPFVSYGGTNLVTHLFAIGLFFSATRENVVAAKDLSWRDKGEESK